MVTVAFQRMGASRGSSYQACLLARSRRVGLGAVSMAILGSAAADITGLFAAGVLAGVGLWLLPRNDIKPRHNSKRVRRSERDSTQRFHSDMQGLLADVERLRGRLTSMSA